MSFLRPERSTYEVNSSLIGMLTAYSQQTCEADRRASETSTAWAQDTMQTGLGDEVRRVVLGRISTSHAETSIARKGNHHAHLDAGADASDVTCPIRYLDCQEGKPSCQ